MKKISLALLISLNGFMAFAQTTTPLESDWEKKLFISEYALPLLMEAAIAHAPELQNADATNLIAVEQRKVIRKNFYSGFSLNSAYQYGTLRNWGSTTEPISSLNAFNQPIQAQYFAGFSIALPLGQLLSRHNLTKIQDLTISQTVENRKIVERSIRQLVITRYQAMVLAKGQLELHQEAFQSAVVSQEIANRQFKRGSILIDAMSTVQQTYTTAAVALQSAKVNYETSLLMMEETIGTKITDLIQSK